MDAPDIKQAKNTTTPPFWLLFFSALILLTIVLTGIYYQATKKSLPAQTIVLVMVDTLRADALGAYGNPMQVSPNIDKLAQDGVLFSQAFASSGWTLPSAASVFTATWPSLHGAMGKDRTHAPIRTDIPVSTEILQQAGFNTFAVTNAMFINSRFGFDRGFDVFDHDPALVGRARNAKACVDLVLDYLGNNRDEANFIFLHLFDPHLPYEPPKEYHGKFATLNPEKSPPLYMKDCMTWPGQNEASEFPSKRGQANQPPPQDHIDYLKGVYYEEVNYVDDQLGRLFKAMEEMGLYSSSTIILTSDHGEEFWDHAGFEHGHTLFDELIRVPLIVKLPSTLNTLPSIHATQVRTLDIMPTLFEQLALPMPESFIGKSLLPVIKGLDTTNRPVFAENTLYGTEQIAVRDGKYKLIVDLGDGENGDHFEFYNIETNPKEDVDAQAKYPEEFTSYKSRLLEHFNEIRGASVKAHLETPLQLDQSEIDALESLGYIR